MSLPGKQVIAQSADQGNVRPKLLRYLAGSLRQTNAGIDMKEHSLHLIFTFYLNRGTPVLELFPVVVFQ